MMSMIGFAASPGQRCLPWLSRHSQGDSKVMSGADSAVVQRQATAIVNVTRVISRGLVLLHDLALRADSCVRKIAMFGTKSCSVFTAALLLVWIDPVSASGRRSPTPTPPPAGPPAPVLFTPSDGGS